MPAHVREFCSVFKPRIAAAITLSALAGIAVTQGLAPTAGTVLALVAAVFLSAASAGAFNQYAERDLDRQMARTRRRPFASGRCTAEPAWLGGILLLLALSVAAAAWAVNWVAAVHVFMGAFIYGIVYTLWLRRRTTLNIVVALLLLVPASTTAHTPSATDPEAAIAYSQAAVGRQIEDLAFVDAMRRPVRLSAYRGKPVVVNLVYTGCADICPVIVRTLYRAVSVAQGALGPDSFRVVTIGFDAHDDTPERMRAFARSQGVDLPNWEFLSGDKSTIETLAAQLGFVYFPSPKGFDHLAQTTILGPDGRVYRQVYGSDFDPPALVEPLKDLAYGMQGSLMSPSSVINRVRLFCTLYDPRLGRYGIDYSMLIGGTVGFFSLAAIAFVAARGWWRSRPGRA